MRSSKRDWASRSLVSRASGARASSARAERDTDLGYTRDRHSRVRKSGKPDLRGPSAARSAISGRATRPFSPGSRLSLRLRRRFGRDTSVSTLKRSARQPLFTCQTALANSSQRFARPLNLRARRRVSLFPFSPNGERSAEKAQTCRACEARPTTLARRGARPAGRARLSALHRGDFRPGAALLGFGGDGRSGSMQRVTRGRVVVPGGRVPGASRVCGCEPQPRAPLPAPPQDRL